MDYRALINFFGRKIKEDNISAYAAQAALFIIMSIIPFLLVFLALIRFTPVTEDMVFTTVHLILPDSVSPWIESLIDEVYHNSVKVIWIALIFGIYSSAKCIHSLRNGLNTVYGIKETRNWFKLRARAMLETFALIWLIILSLLLVVFGKRIQSLVAQNLPGIENVTNVLIEGRLVIMFFFLIIVFTFIYRFMPNRDATFRSQLVGAVGCAVAWYFFTFGMSFVLNLVDGFSLYGSLATIVMVMFWLYICMSIFLICGEINNAFEMIVAEFKMNRARRKRKTASESGKIENGELR